MLSRTITLALVVATSSFFVGCLDWSNLGGNKHPGGGREGEGEGEGAHAGEGEGAQAGEGEGAQAGEGEGEGSTTSGPQWVVIDAPISAQAELASASSDQLSSSNGRLFAVGSTHVFELVSDALTPIAAPAVPCANVSLTGPVVVDGTDILVASSAGAVRFHSDGSCAVPIALTSTPSVHVLTPFQGGVLIFDGLAVHLFDSNGTDIADHAFDTSTDGAFYPDPQNASAILLVRGDAQSPGQEVRITQPQTDLVVQIVSDSVGVLAKNASTSATYTQDSALGAPFLHVTSTPVVPSGQTPPTGTTVDLRLAPSSDFVSSVAADKNGEVAFAGTSALLAHVDLSASTLNVTSLSGQRFGTLKKIALSPGGEVWAAGQQVILHWSSADAAAFSDPDIIFRDALVNVNDGMVAIDGSLFYVDNQNRLTRADVSGNTLVVNELVDSVSFQPVSANDSRTAYAFIAANGTAPARLVEVGGFDVTAYELTADLGAVTAKLTAQTAGTSASATAILPDASKAGLIVFGELFTCALTFPPGQSPTTTCDSGRSTGVGGGNALSIFDPSPGVDDETYIVSGSGEVGIVPPGASSATTVTLDVDTNVKPLLVHDCVLGFSSRSWNALDQSQPLSPKSRRGFPVGDVAIVGSRILIVGGDVAGQLSTIPAPTSSSCTDSASKPVLDGAAMLANAVRSQTSLEAAAFLSGELYTLDADGVLWHVPTP
jgi:hypothetical protein